MTTIPPATPVSPGSAAAAAPPAPAAGSTAVLTQLPEAVRAAAPGTVISGTVVGRDSQGQTLLQTNAGVIGLRTAALAIGSQITLQIQAAGSQLQAVLLSAIAPKPGGTLPPGAARGAGPVPPGAAPATTLAVSSGPVLTATVLSPNTGGPLPQIPPGGNLPATSASASTNLSATPASSPAGAPAGAPTLARAAGAAPPPVTAAQPGPGASPASTAAGAGLPSSPLVAQSVPGTTPSISSAAATYAATPGAAPASPGGAAPPASAAGGAPPAPGAPATAPAAASPAGTAVPTASAAATAGTPPRPAATAAGTSPPPAAQGPAPAPSFQPAASGTPVQLRLLGPAPAGAPTANQITGTVVGYAPGGQAVVDTALGRLALQLPPGASQPAAGSGLLFELLGLGARAASTAGAAQMPTLGREWPALKSAMTALADIDLPLARQILEVNLPRLASPRFLGQVLHHLASPAASEARALLGDTAVAMLERAGRGDILARLDAELREMTRLNSTASDWRVFFVPILSANELRQLRIFTRKRKSDRDKERDGGRFVVEVDFDDLGALQIDGLVQKPRIDVILRSHVELSPGMQAGIAEVFGRTCDASGLVGKIFFQAAATFPVSPLDEIAKAGPGLSV